MRNSISDRALATESKAFGRSAPADETDLEAGARANADLAGAGVASAADVPAPGSRSLRDLERLAELLTFLRAPRAASIRYGRVRYEGVLYVVARHADPIEDLDEFCRRTVDRGGRSRYGTFGRPTWYGALDPFTAIAEAAYHALADAEWKGGGEEEILGSMYQLRVRGRFVDLHGRERTQPEIVGDDYAATQSLARQVRAASTLSGVLYPSARSSGTCLAVFVRHALRSAKHVDAISMRRVTADTLKVRLPWSGKWCRLRLEDLRRAPAARLECA